MIKMIQKNMNKKGFTLVELIIVIAVMAILAAIVVPRMTGITQTLKVRADERMADSYAREIEVQIQLGKSITGTGAEITSAVLGGTESPVAPKSLSGTGVAAPEFKYSVVSNVIYVYAEAGNGTAAIDDDTKYGSFTGAKVKRTAGTKVE